MADLVLNWGALGPFGTPLTDTPPGSAITSVDTGGVAVDITFDGQDVGAQAFTGNAPTFVPSDEDFDPSSYLKLFGEGGDPGAALSPTSQTVLDFRSINTDVFTDSVQNVAFRLNDVDSGAEGDLDGPGTGFEDNVTILAFDAEGNAVPVTLTASGTASISGGTAVGTSASGFEDADGSVLVEIAGPVSRIEVTYANGGDSEQGVLISDVAFTTVDVVGANLPPTAVDDTAETDEEVAVIIDVLANDDDPEGGDLTVTEASVDIGEVSINPDNTLTYTPPAGYSGPVTASYTIEDPEGATASGEVAITVDPLDPVNTPPVANDDTAATMPDTSVIIPVLDNDSDAEDDVSDLLITFVTDPENGTAVDNADGTITYTPNPGYTGTDTFEYDISDSGGDSDTAIVTVNVNVDANSPPVAVDDSVTTPIGTAVVIDAAGNDTDPDGDPLFVSSVGDPGTGALLLAPDGSAVTFQPDPGFTGQVTIPYTVSDGIATDDGEIVVTVGDDTGRIDADVFPVDPSVQDLDPLDGFDQDPDPLNNVDDETGTGAGEFISTGDDADTISAGGGDDTVEPGIDDDLVDLGAGDDSLFDVQGADTVSGGQGDDTIIAGINTFFGTPDAVFSDYEGDSAAYAPGSPLNGFGFTSDPNQEDGRDSIQGNLGDDFIATGDDRDTIDGGGDDDTVDGGIDDDLIMGGQGNDSLIGSHGSDTIDGGQGDDFIDGANLAGLEQTDDVDVNTENDRDSLFGALGDDTIFGGDDDDTLRGDSGNDVLDGGIDEDILLGGADADTLLGGQGDDTLNGGAGADDVQGGAGRDVIFVDSAADGTDDTVDGGAGGFVDQPNPEDPPNEDYDILNLSGAGVQDVDWRLANTVADSNGNGIDGTVEFLNASGDVTGTMDFFEIEEVVPCFTPGTLIATPQGERLVEDLQIGDRVITRDNGIQEIKWVGRKDLTGFELARKPHFKPILIQKAALGNNLPEHDMLVSPNHRVLVANDKTALYFEEREVLVAAKHLTGLEGVDEVEANGVAYIHVMFENHEVILSNGAWTESFQPGDYSLKGIGNSQRQEIFELFPELEQSEGLKAYGSARRSLKKHEAALLTK